MKKILSIILVISLLSGLLALSSFAESAYPESEHNYANNTDKVWTYQGADDTEKMIITFSEDFDLGLYEYYDNRIVIEDKNLTQEVVDAIEKDGYYEKGDILQILYEDDFEIYYERELAGESILVYGNYFEIRLISDASGTAYGFKIDKIEEIKYDVNPDDDDEEEPEEEKTPENSGIVNYYIDGKIESSEYFYDGEEIQLDRYYHARHKSNENRAIVGWKTENGTELYYKTKYSTDVYTGIIAQAGKEYNLYPIYCKLGMTTEEVYSFNNTGDVFDHGFVSYVYTPKIFGRQFIDWLATFGLSPMLPLALIGIVFNTAYWPYMEFDGSCCGFPITTILQHYGKIDLLSEQGVDKVSELKPTEELQSKINFYNNAAEIAHLVNHWAFEPGTEEYTRQLKDLYAALEEGTPVYFEFYPRGDPPLISIADHFKNHTDGTFIDSINGAHGILLDGAFTDNEGNHILLGWDNNSEFYSNGRADTLMINADFTEISYGRILNGFAWNEDLSTFESFPTEGLPNPFAWHINFIEHIFELICHSITNLFN